MSVVSSWEGDLEELSVPYWQDISEFWVFLWCQESGFMGDNTPYGSLGRGTTSPRLQLLIDLCFLGWLPLHLQVEADPSLHPVQTTSCFVTSIPNRGGIRACLLPRGGLQLALLLFFTLLFFYVFLECIVSFPLFTAPNSSHWQRPLHSGSEGECVNITMLTWDVSFNKYLWNCCFVSLKYHLLVFPAKNDLEASRIFISIWAELKSRWNDS